MFWGGFGGLNPLELLGSLGISDSEPNNTNTRPTNPRVFSAQAHFAAESRFGVFNASSVWFWGEVETCSACVFECFFNGNQRKKKRKDGKIFGFAGKELISLLFVSVAVFYPHFCSLRCCLFLIRLG